MKTSSAPSSRRTPRAELVVSLVALAALAALAGCDRGVPAPPPTAVPVHVVGVSVGPERPLHAGEAIVIAFDRYLDPRTATRQSFAVLDAFGTLTPNPLVLYDPATRTVTLASATADPADWLLVDQPYTLLIGIPAEGQFLGGVRGLDGGTLSRDQVLLVPFFARAAAPPGAPDVPVSFCEQVQPLLGKACARCHDGSTSGLDLRSARGIFDTALGKLARGNSRGATPAPTPGGDVFGVGSTLLDPPSAGTSVLLSTVLAREIGTNESRAFCSDSARPEPVPNVTVLADPGDAERERLELILPGGPMPPRDAPEAALSLDERRLLSRWIREGAALQECSATCP